MTKKLNALLEMMNQMKDDYQTGQEKMWTTVDELRDNMQATVDELKDEIRVGQEKMQTTLNDFAQIIEAQFERMEKEFLNARKDVEEKLVNVEHRIEEDNERVETEIVDIRKDVEEKIATLEQGMEIKLRELVPISYVSRSNHTPNFISQEVASRSWHVLEADVWGLGCLLDTLLVGTQDVRSALTGVVMANYTLPGCLSAEARDLIDSSLQKNPTDKLRLEQILDHPFKKSRLQTASVFSHHALSCRTAGGYSHCSQKCCQPADPGGGFYTGVFSDCRASSQCLQSQCCV